MSKMDSANKIANSSKNSNIGKQNAKNEAMRLEQKVKSQQAANKANLASANSSTNSHSKKNNNSSMKEKIQKKGGSAALQAMGVPKEFADKAMDFAQSEEGKKLTKKMIKHQMGPIMGSLINKLMESGQSSSQEETPDGGEGDFKLQSTVIKLGLVLCGAIFPIIIFCCLFISASQIFLNSISLGNADSLSMPEADKEINKKGTEGLDEEKTDDDVAYDIYISDNKAEILKNNKLNNYNIIQIVKETTYYKRKYNEASLSQLEDFYPSVSDLSKNYDENMVYDFFFKMYNLYVTYRDTYGVHLDLPLLMATLNLQSSDKNVVFSSNLSAEDRKKTARKMPIDELDYYYDWSSYKVSRNNSTHDMEILAQHMISKQVQEKCVDSNGNVSQEKILKDDEIGTQTLSCKDGETYQTEEKGYLKDDDKYREFLKEFLEKKYYLSGENTIEGDTPTKEEAAENVDKGNSQTGTPASGSFRSWTQCGQSWSSTIVPKSKKNMCKIGCLITSVTMQIARSGTAITTDSIDPGIALKKYSFYSGGNFDWYSTTNIAPNFKYYTRIITLGMNKEKTAKKIASYDSNRYYGILLVSEKNELVGDHFVALDYVDLTTNEIYIMDPLSTSNTKLYEKYKIYKAYFYEKRD